MNDLHVYDPPLCCSSGVCGPSIDAELVRVNADLEWLKSRGISVERHNLGQQPTDFTSVDAVRERLQNHGQEGLPLLLLDGDVVAAGFYPTRDQFASLFGLKPEPAPAAGGCCG